MHQVALKGVLQIGEKNLWSSQPRTLNSNCFQALQHFVFLSLYLELLDPCYQTFLISFPLQVSKSNHRNYFGYLKVLMILKIQKTKTLCRYVKSLNTSFPIYFLLSWKRVAICFSSAKSLCNFSGSGGNEGLQPVITLNSDYLWFNEIIGSLKLIQSFCSF